MNNKKIFEISESFKLYYDDKIIKEGYSISLEEYYCKSFFTKEPETIEWINSKFKPGEVFLDIGANVGQYSIYAAIIHPSIQIYSVEPFISNYERLLENIELNSVTKIIPLLIAFSNTSRLEKFFIGDVRVGASGNQIGSNVDESGNIFDHQKVSFLPTFSLDDFLKLFKIETPNHIKIDVDGIEDQINEGMKNTLKIKNLISVLIEVNNKKENYGKYLKILEIFRENGFSVDDELNNIADHSRNRRKGSVSENAENIIFSRY